MQTRERARKKIGSENNVCGGSAVCGNVGGILPVRLVRVSHTNRHETNTLNVRNSAPAPLVQLYAFSPR